MTVSQAHNRGGARNGAGRPIDAEAARLAADYAITRKEAGPHVHPARAVVARRWPAASGDEAMTLAERVRGAFRRAEKRASDQPLAKEEACPLHPDPADDCDCSWH